MARQYSCWLPGHSARSCPLHLLGPRTRDLSYLCLNIAFADAVRGSVAGVSAGLSPQPRDVRLTNGHDQ